MTFAIFLLVALSLINCPVPCSADPPPSLQAQTDFASSTLEIDLDVFSEFLSEPSVPPDTCDSSSSDPVEMQPALSQAPILAELTTAQPAGPSSSEPSETDEEEEVAGETIADPIEPVNRAFFQFNDKFYFWLLKPVATAYKAVISEEFRVCFRNFFSNLATPVRMANCLLQGKFKGAGNETGRFLLNSTFGFFGFFDQAKDHFQIEKEDRDFGQTLGIWGLGPSFYINWPILGPSSLRDTGGFVGDLLLDPRTYLLKWPVSTASRSTEVVNKTSLSIGDYEDLKKAAIDPYVAVRDAYHQYRQNKIKKK